MHSFDFLAFAVLLFFLVTLGCAGYSHYRYRERNNSIYRKTYGKNYHAKDQAKE